MTITREDVLRELELMPVWTLNPSLAGAQAVPSSVDAISTPILAANQRVIEAPVSVVLPQDATPVIPDVIADAAPEITRPKMAVTWLLYCPLDITVDTDALTLLHNMVRAMQLLSTEYQLVHDAETFVRYQSVNTLLFGLDAAQTCLGKAVHYDATKEQPFIHAQSHCWVLQHPKQLMENPSLKREAWHTMCAAKTYAQKV
jgi:uracil-DNA glycosylase